ncbi:MAG TPA: hypothetical protein VJK51_01005 [Candidatus Nanoarchaeia archaeon]|nr:hypothetical protein [Candidatus Nanoarchaeia archaeon]
MPNITLALPEDTFKKMKQLQFIRWSEVARQAIEERISLFEQVENIASKSKLTEEDAKDIARKIKIAANKRFMNESHN